MQLVQLQIHGFHGNPAEKNTDRHHEVGMKAKGLSFCFVLFFSLKTLR